MHGVVEGIIRRATRNGRINFVNPEWACPESEIIKLFEVEGGVIRHAIRIDRINFVNPEWGYKGDNRHATRNVRINYVDPEWACPESQIIKSLRRFVSFSGRRLTSVKRLTAMS